MKLWLISQTENKGYDTYDSAVVAAETENAARLIHPSSHYLKPVSEWGKSCWDWATSPDKVTAKLIGEALPNTPPGSICSSFNAG
jgi:hypothetical protein